MIQKLEELYQKQDKIIFYSASLSFIISAIIPITIFLNLSKLPKNLPLFYSLPWGENYLVDLIQFNTVSAITALTTLVNLTLSWYLHSSQVVLKRILNLSSLAIAILLLITSLKIIYIFI